jgi:hypothetical protein
MISQQNHDDDQSGRDDFSVETNQVEHPQALCHNLYLGKGKGSDRFLSPSG